MGKSSKDKRDAYYRLAKEQGWRARSAFKLLQLNEEFGILADVKRVVDLCAAPGSWSQVLSRVLIKRERFSGEDWENIESVEALEGVDEDERGWLRTHKWTDERLERVNSVMDMTKCQLNDTIRKEKDDGVEEVRIVAVDLQPMTALEGVITLQADITQQDTVTKILEALNGKDKLAQTNTVDVVLSDGAPDVTGLHDLDMYLQGQLLWSALSMALCLLRPGGTFVAKVFRAKHVDFIYEQMRSVFEQVCISKPRSSRSSSLEAFIVCMGMKPCFKDWGKCNGLVDLYSLTRVNAGDEMDESHKQVDTKWIVPFLACGDLTSFDSDTTYKLPEGYISLDPVQPPITPPYRLAILKRRNVQANGQSR